MAPDTTVIVAKRPKGRRQFFIYIPVDIIKELDLVGGERVEWEVVPKLFGKADEVSLTIKR